MFAKDIKKDILSSQAFLLNGDDLYWLEYANNFFVGLVCPEYRDVNIKIYDKLESLAEIIFTLSSFSFNEERQLIFVRDTNYKANKDELKVLFQLVEQGIDPYILVFENVGFLTAKEKKFVKEIDCSKLKKFDLMPIVQKKFDKYGGIERGALNLLLDYTNNEMAKINLEYNKLVEYAEGKKITAEMIELLVAEDSEVQVYHFASSIAEGKEEQAIIYLDKLMRRGYRKSYILTSLVNQYRRILHSAISPRSDQEIADIFRVHKYAIIKARQIKNISKVALKRTLDMLVDYEYKFKSGIMSEATAFDAVVGNLLAK